MGKLKVAIVGSRGFSTIAGFQACRDVEVAAVCDLNQEVLDKCKKEFGISRTYRIYEDMLLSDLDIVVVATPMQLHVPQTLQALEAGKHVLSEVTAAVTMDELWWLKEAVEKSKKIYMMAENFCYIPQVQQINAMVKAGLFGEVYFGEGEYLHNVRAWATYPDGRTSWRKYWQLGKRGAFYPTHSLGPVMKWFSNDRIKSLRCVSAGHHTDSQFRQDDTTLTLCELESGKLIKIRVDCISDRPRTISYYSLQGTKGCYEAPRGLGDTHKIWIREDGYTGDAYWKPLEDYRNYLPERYQNPPEEAKSAGYWGGDFFMIKDFMNAVRGEQHPYVDIYEACEWTAVGLLSELSVMNGGKSIDMPDFRKGAEIIRL